MPSLLISSIWLDQKPVGEEVAVDQEWLAGSLAQTLVAAEETEGADHEQDRGGPAGKLGSEQQRQDRDRQPQGQRPEGEGARGGESGQGRGVTEEERLDGVGQRRLPPAITGIAQDRTRRGTTSRDSGRGPLDDQPRP